MMNVLIWISSCRWLDANTNERLRAYGEPISWNQRTGAGSVRCDDQGFARASKDRTRSGVPVEREL